MKLKSEKIDGFLSKKKNITLIYIIVIIGVLLLSISSFLPQDEPKSDTASAALNEKLEQRLSEALSQIRGVGKAHVLITYKSTASSVTAKDTRESSSSASTDREEKNVIIGSGSAQRPFVLKEEMPKVMGVIVVAEGGNDAGIKREIIQAVKALTGASANNIGVFPKKE